MLESMSVYSTISSGCSSLENLDPEVIHLTQLDDSIISHVHCMPNELKESEELTKVDINKTSTNWDGCYSQGGEIISKMANVTYVTSPKYYNTTPSPIATAPIWVKHYKK